MIFGIGTDVCDIRRIEATFERQGERFARKVLGEQELVVWQQRSERWPRRGLRYLATRFSTKEAFSKAIEHHHSYLDGMAAWMKKKQYWNLATTELLAKG